MHTDKNTDAFRLGCYSAAKHAGATHDEAIDFVAGLDRQARQQDAFALGVHKTACEHGATPEEAAALVKVANTALFNIGNWLGRGANAIGSGSGKVGKGLQWLGGKVTDGAADLAIGAGKGLGKGPRPAWMNQVVGAMARHPKTVGAATAGVAASPLALWGMSGGEKQPGGQNQLDAQQAQQRQQQQMLEFLMWQQAMQSQQGQRGPQNPYFNPGY